MSVGFGSVVVKYENRPVIVKAEDADRFIDPYVDCPDPSDIEEMRVANHG